MAEGKNRQRVVAHIDMDCFYCGVEAKLNPELLGKPVVVVQYNSSAKFVKTVSAHENRILTTKPKGVFKHEKIGTFSDGDGYAGSIAVNYEARAAGIKRGMTAYDCRDICEDIICVRVPTKFDKPDLAIYRKYGQEVLAKLKSLMPKETIVERASIDEMYFDLTEGIANILTEELKTTTLEHLAESYINRLSNACCYVAGNTQEIPIEDKIKPFTYNNVALLLGAVLVGEGRNAVINELELSCSGGIGENKLLAKLGSGMNKPKKQTLVLPVYTPAVLAPLPIKKLRSLGGKFGKEVREALDTENIGEIVAMDPATVRAAVGDGADTVLNLCNGICAEPVQPRVAPESIGASRRFHGKNQLRTQPDVKSRLTTLISDIIERCEEDGGRVPTHMVVGVEAEPGGKTSKTGGLPRTGIDQVEPLVVAAWKTIEPWLRQQGNNVVITFLSVTVSDFQASKSQITNFFKAGPVKQNSYNPPSAKKEPFTNSVKQEVTSLTSLQGITSESSTSPKVLKLKDVSTEEINQQVEEEEAPPSPEKPPQKMMSLLAPLKVKADLISPAKPSNPKPLPKKKGGPLDAFFNSDGSAVRAVPAEDKPVVKRKLEVQHSKPKVKIKAKPAKKIDGQSSLKNWIKKL